MLCTKCQAPVRKLDMEEHMEENHALVECQCKVKVENAQLEKHKVIQKILIKSYLILYNPI